MMVSRKTRTGKECKKINCEHYESYVKWSPSDSVLNFCMNCRNAHVSQYKAKVSEFKQEEK